jgi:hypothetical protein
MVKENKMLIGMLILIVVFGYANWLNGLVQ